MIRRTGRVDAIFYKNFTPGDILYTCSDKVAVINIELCHLKPSFFRFVIERYFSTAYILIVPFENGVRECILQGGRTGVHLALVEDRKSTRLNSSHVAISYAVFCLK